MRVLGIDPGLRNLGWGVIDAVGSRLSHVANGVIHSEGGDLAARLLSLHSALTRVLATYQPDAAAVEQTFVNKDAVATLKLGQARGIALLVPAQARRRWLASVMPKRPRLRTWCGFNCLALTLLDPMPPTRWPLPFAMPIICKARAGWPLR